MLLTAILLLARTAATFLPMPQGLEKLAPPAQEIVVTGRRGPPVPKAEPIEYYRRHCFDANRLTGRSEPPATDPDWRPLDDDDLRARLGIKEADPPYYVLRDPARGHLLLLKFEQFSRPWRTTENRCTLVIIGGTAHEHLTSQMNALFRGPGTQRHVGEPDGYEKMPGWHQRLWNAMPNRRSKSWQVVEAKGAARAAGTFIVVVEPTFYDEHNYVIGDLKTKDEGNPALSILTFGLIRRNEAEVASATLKAKAD
jgi:hypothetical protein